MPVTASSTVFHGPPSRCGSVRSGSDSRLGCHSLPSRASLPYLGKAIATLDTVTLFSASDPSVGYASLEDDRREGRSVLRVILSEAVG